jgi:hypothetical protein
MQRRWSRRDMTRPSDITLICVRHRGTPLTAEQREQQMHALATCETTVGIDISRARRWPNLRKPRKPTLASVAKQVSKAALDVARYEVKPDGTIAVVTGKPEPAVPENAWPLDEFRRKETKQ